MLEVNPAYGYTTAEKAVHHAVIIPAIDALMPAGAGLDILDIGCGAGYVAGHLAAQGHRVTGVDPAEDGIALARRSFPAVRFEVGSGYDDLSGMMPEGSWDVIVAAEVIEHLYAPQRFLRNIHGYLREGGCIILTTPYHGYLKNLALALANAWDRHFTVSWEGGHIKFFSRHTLSAMLVDCGYGEIEFRLTGRFPGLWKEMICRARKLG